MTPQTGLYLHWPFCSRICPYCDFTVARSRHEDIEAWTESLITDIKVMQNRIGPRELVSLYFGGGTPSLMPPEHVARIIETVRSIFDLKQGAEITLEANPTDAEAARFEGFRQAGVTRLSLGVQSLSDNQLAFLGRNHSAGEARRAADTALEVFDRVSLDFIYALPDERVSDWQARLREALQLGAQHYSFYQLTVEPETAFSRAVARKEWRPSPDDTAADLYQLTSEITVEYGMPAYEVSNHARPGAEAIHNSLYWHGADWLAVGPGAHGRLTIGGQRFASAGGKDIRQWTNLNSANRYMWEELDSEAQTIELISSALRTTGGLALEQLKEGHRKAILVVKNNLIEERCLEEEDGYLRIRPAFRLITDHIVSRLIEAL